MYRPILAITSTLGLELAPVPPEIVAQMTQKADVAALKAYAPAMVVGAIAVPSLVRYCAGPAPAGMPSWLYWLGLAIWTVNGALFGYDIRKAWRPYIYEGVLVHHVK